MMFDELPESRAEYSGGEEPGNSVKLPSDFHNVGRKKLIISLDNASCAWIALRRCPPRYENETAPAAHGDESHSAYSEYSDCSGTITAHYKTSAIKLFLTSAEI